uniref:polynucleotide adenylyltransferase n=1 Tax=Anthurium amnicola TaxID=1678845 RepID=A0A1D1YHE9_9ARAE
MKSSGFIYETLGPLSLSDDDLSQQYAVFRNEIRSSTCPEDGPHAADYFSLDASVEAVDARREERMEGSPSPQSFCQTAKEEKQSPEFAWFRAGSRFRSPMVQLHREILDFCDFISPTSEEQLIRDTAVRRVFEVIKYIWPHCNVEVFGSFRTGLYLPTSDIDVVILDSKVKTPQMGLRALSRAISQKSVGKKIQVIAKARVPIIKFVEKQSGIAFDISFDMKSGPKAADFIKDAVMKMPALRPLCLILKVFLQQRELNEVFLGGIGSYALIAMLIAHLQIHWRGQKVSSQRLQEQNLGVLLVDFFDLYGRKLNNWHVGVSCNIAGNFFLKNSRGFLNDDRPYLLSIEDPQERDNDIGRNSYNYFKVRAAFATAFSSLTDANNIIGLGPLKSILGTIIRPDPILLKRNGGSKGDLTFNSLLPGAGELGTLRYANAGDLLCNWQLMDEEPLSREIIVIDDKLSLSQKRRILKSNHTPSENGNSQLFNIRSEEEGGKRVKRTKNQHRKGYRDGERRSVGSSAQDFSRSPWSL